MSSRIGILPAAALAAMALVGGMGSPAAEARTVTAHPVTVTVPAQSQQQERTAPARAISARDEVERVDSFALLSHRHRRQWDGKNRTSGDRAHKRMKRSRSTGRRYHSRG